MAGVKFVDAGVSSGGCGVLLAVGHYNDALTMEVQSKSLKLH